MAMQQPMINIQSIILRDLDSYWEPSCEDQQHYKLNLKHIP